MERTSHWALATALLFCITWPKVSLAEPAAEEHLTRKPTPRMAQWGVKEFGRMQDHLWFRGDRPRITVPLTATAPAIDGKPNDPCWQNATRITKFIATQGFAATPPLRYGLDFCLGQTELRLCYDSKAIYIYMKCHEEHMPLLQMTVDQRDGATWKDDCLEFFLDPKLTRTMAYHLIYNPAAALYDAQEDGTTKDNGKVKEDSKWNWDGCEAQVERAADYWALEAAIPFAPVGGPPEPGDVWGANFCRQRRASTQVAIWGYSTWSGIPHTFYGRPDMLGDIVFGDLAVEATEIPEPFLGQTSWTVRIRNLSKEPRPVTADVRIASLADENVSKPVTATLPPSQESTVEVPYGVGLEDVQFAAVRVRDAAGSLLFVDRRGLEIEPILPILDTTLPRVKRIMARSSDPAFLASIGEYLQKLEEMRQRVETFKKEASASPMNLAKRDEWLQLLKETRAVSSLSSYLVWTKSPWLKTGPTDYPPLLKDADRLTVEACVNEYEPAVAMITNLTEDFLELLVLGSLPGLREVRAPLAVEMQRGRSPGPRLSSGGHPRELGETLRQAPGHC